MVLEHISWCGPSQHVGDIATTTKSGGSLSNLLMLTSPGSLPLHSKTVFHVFMKRKSSRAQQSNDSHPASLYFYGRHELRKNNDNSCWNFTKDYFSSKSLSRRDTSFKCYSREKPYSSRERYSRSSTVCSVCGRLGHYKKDVL